MQRDWWWCSIMSYPPQLHFHLSKLSRDFYSCKRREVYTNATYRNNYFGYLPYLCITCPLSWWRHFIYSHTNTICSEEGWDYLSVFPSCVALCPSLPRISIWLVTGLDIVLLLTLDKSRLRPARAATGAAWWEQPPPSSPLVGAPCFWSEGGWVHRLLRPEAMTQLDVM